jgi:DNA-binding NarL/FixJ family response regulator
MTPALASRVLIIEDEAMLRSSMARSLSRVTNVEVLTASTLGEGLAVIDMTPPALILSDIDLPDRSGLELIGELGPQKPAHSHRVHLGIPHGVPRADSPARERRGAREARRHRGAA